MIPNPTPTTFIMLLFGVLTFILFMLLPAFLELKKPKDAGPKMIMDDVVLRQVFQIKWNVPLMNIEEEKLRFDKIIIMKMRDIIAVLPNLET